MGRPKDPRPELAEEYARGLCRTAAALERIADELLNVRRLLELQATPAHHAQVQSTPEWELRERWGTRFQGDSTPAPPASDNLAAKAIENERLRNPGARQRRFVQRGQAAAKELRVEAAAAKGAGK